MIEVEMTKDIREYSPKTLGPFTTRQLVCILIGLLYGVPVMLIVPLSIPGRMLVGILVMLPVLLCGWIKPYGIPLERFAKRCMLPLLIGNGKRKVIAKNIGNEWTVKHPEITNVTRNKNIRKYK